MSTSAKFGGCTIDLGFKGENQMTHPISVGAAIAKSVELDEVVEIEWSAYRQSKLEKEAAGSTGWYKIKGQDSVLCDEVCEWSGDKGNSSPWTVRLVK